MTDITIKGYEMGYIVQYVVADLDGTVIDTFDTREEAEACADEGQQIVELDGYGYVAEITETSDDANYLGDVFTDAGPSIADQCEDLPVSQVSDYGAAQPYTGYPADLYPGFPWTR